MSDSWSWNNALDAEGTLISSSSGSAVELLTSNLRDPRIGKLWRAGGMPTTLSIQLPAGASISLFGLFGVNFGEAGEITLRLGTSEGLGDLWETVIDPSANTYVRQAVFALRDSDGDLAPVPAAYATVSIADGAALEIGRIWLGGADWKTNVGHAVNGSSWQGEDFTQRTRLPRSGAFLADRGARLRTFTANYEMISEDEYTGPLFEMDERGLAQQMLFVPNPDVYDSHKFAVLGYLSEIPATNWRAYMTAGRAITIQEAG